MFERIFYVYDITDMLISLADALNSILLDSITLPRNGNLEGFNTSENNLVDVEVMTVTAWSNFGDLKRQHSGQVQH